MAKYILVLTLIKKYIYLVYICEVIVLFISLQKTQVLYFVLKTHNSLNMYRYIFYPYACSF